MRRLFIWTLFLFSCSVYGQDNAATKVRKFFISANFSPDYCYRTLIKNDKSITDSAWTNAKSILDTIEVAKFGYTSGLVIGYQLKDFIGIETGIQYSNKGYKTVPIMTIYDWNKPGALATNIFSHSYLDFPLRVNFTFFKKKVQVIASVGVVLNYIVQSSIKTIPQTPTTDFNTQKNINHYDFKKINLSPTVSVGLKYKLNDRVSLRAEPTFRYGLFNMDDKDFAGRHLWNLGLNVGVYVGL